MSVTKSKAASAPARQLPEHVAVQTDKVLIVGSAGMLGRELTAAGSARGFAVETRADAEAMDITDPEAVRAAIESIRPAVVLNAAAYTDVDGAEHEPELAMKVNRDGAACLAAACRESGSMLVHYSTDYVFDGSGDRPYRPEDPTNPTTAYGRTKLAGEQAIRASGCRHLIIRTSWLFAPHGNNFVRTILRLAEERDQINVVNDQRGRPASCRDLAEMTIRLIVADPHGGRPRAELLHATNSGECTWFEFACEIVRLAGLGCDVQPCTSEMFPRPARRPAYSVLDLTELIQRLGKPRSWREALADCMEEIRTAADAPEWEEMNR